MFPLTLTYNNLYSHPSCFSADGGEDEKSDIMYSDIKISNHQRHLLRQSKGNISFYVCIYFMYLLYVCTLCMKFHACIFVSNFYRKTKKWLKGTDSSVEFSCFVSVFLTKTHCIIFSNMLNMIQIP